MKIRDLLLTLGSVAIVCLIFRGAPVNAQSVGEREALVGLANNHADAFVERLGVALDEFAPAAKAQIIAAVLAPSSQEKADMEKALAEQARKLGVAEIRYVIVDSKGDETAGTVTTKEPADDTAPVEATPGP